MVGGRSAGGRGGPWLALAVCLGCLLGGCGSGEQADEAAQEVTVAGSANGKDNGAVEVPGGYSLTADQVRAKLDALPYEFSYREVPYSDGMLVAGAARAGGVAVPFATYTAGTRYSGELLRHKKSEDLDVSRAGNLFIELRLPYEASPRYREIANDVFFALCNPSGQNCV